MSETIEVIIPTRLAPMQECWDGIEQNINKTLGDWHWRRNVRTLVDNGEGQTKLRYQGALDSKANYVLLLDDDVKMRPGVVAAYLSKIKEGYDAVCGSTNPAPQNEFSKSIAQFMTDEDTPFYPVGCTLWRREKFLQIMNEVGLDHHRYLGDNLLEAQIVKGGYRVVRVKEAISDHLWSTTPMGFLKKRIVYGEALAELYLVQKRFLRNYLKFLVAIPLSRSRAWFLYRLGTWIGMTWRAIKQPEEKDKK